MSATNMSVIAAGIAFYEIWALFPALVALVILGGIFFGEGAVVRLLSWIRIDLPETFDVLVVGQLKAIAQQSRGISSLTLVGAVLFSFWSAMRGVRGLIQALNIVCGEDEKRPFWRRQVVAFWLSCFSGGLLLIAISLIVSMPPYGARKNDEIASCFHTTRRTTPISTRCWDRWARSRSSFFGRISTSLQSCSERRSMPSWSAS